MQQLDENLWLLTYPLKILGADIIRNVAVIRLNSGKLIIHSTGPFTPEDISSIRAEGEPAWLVEAMLDHDTFSEEGHTAFPDTPYFAPPGFEERVTFPTHSLTDPPPEWGDEVKVMPIEGNPSFNEHVFLHTSSRTLIVADLIFNYRKAPSLWTKLLLYPSIGLQHAPGMSKRFRGAITDKAAFRKSLEQMFKWDFDRIIVGHGQVIETDGQSIARRLFEQLRFL